MADRREEIERLGAEIVVTVPEGPEKAAKVASELETPFPIWATETESPHQAYGLDRAWLGMVQRSGTVVVADGTVRYVHVATNPDKSLDLDEVIHNLNQITGGPATSP